LVITNFSVIVKFDKKRLPEAMTQIQVSSDKLDFALETLRQGRFVLLHDSVSRENEVDMVVAAELISPEHVGVMRSNAGGLLCLALGYDIGEKLGIVAMRDILLFAAHQYPVLKSLNEENAPYGGKSAFSITVNHKRTFTGVTDRDRALTISELSKVAKVALNGEGGQELFASEFKAPGHVHLLLESKGALAERRGHTELSVYLCRLAGVTPAAAICEMLDVKTHNALSIDDAEKYAHTHSIPLLDGEQLVANFLERNSS
jgi:3,4-dihydroxy 2-butanone 4-phosphate synthase